MFEVDVRPTAANNPQSRCPLTSSAIGWYVYYVLYLLHAPRFTVGRFFVSVGCASLCLAVPEAGTPLPARVRRAWAADAAAEGKGAEDRRVYSPARRRVPHPGLGADELVPEVLRAGREQGIVFFCFMFVTTSSRADIQFEKNEAFCY